MEQLSVVLLNIKPATMEGGVIAVHQTRVRHYQGARHDDNQWEMTKGMN